MKKAAEKREKMADIVLGDRKELSNTGDDSFVNPTTSSKTTNSA